MAFISMYLIVDTQLLQVLWLPYVWDWAEEGTSYWRTWAEIYATKGPGQRRSA